MQIHCNLSLLIAGLAASVPAQQIWNVNCQGGPEVHFSDLPQAVAAASPGDEIRVYRRQYQPACSGLTYYTAPIIDKPLRIVGFRVGVAPGVDVEGEIRIVGIQAGSQVVLSDLSIASISSPGGIVAQNCSGSILIEDCYYSSLGLPGSVLRFVNCSDVVVRGGTFGLGGSPLEVIDSSVLLSTTSIYQVAPFFGPPYSFSQTAPGMHVMNSTVTLVESIVQADREYSFSPTSNWVARPGVLIDSGTLRIGPGGFIRGGFFALQYPPYNAYGFQATGSNVTIERDPRGTMVVPPPTPVPVVTEIHAMAHDQVTAGAAYTALVAGPPSGFAVLVAGDWLPAGLPTPIGSLQIDPTTLQAGTIVALSPTDGRYLWSLNCPTTVPVAHAFAFQAAVLSPAGVISLTLPSPFAVGWSATTVP